MRSLNLWAVVLAVALAVGLPAASRVAACPVCFGGAMPRKSIVDRVEEARDAVIAEPRPVAEGAVSAAGEDKGAVDYVVKLVLKGGGDLAGGVIPGAGVIVTAPPADSAGAVLGSSESGSRPGRRVLMTRASDVEAWTVGAAVALHHQAFLAAACALPSGSGISADDQLARLGFFRSHLAHRDPLIGEAALLEWARAPYEALRSASAEVEVAQVRAWLADPNFRGGRPLAVVLLGLRGEPSDVAMLDAMSDRAWEEGDTSILGALLTARIEEHGDEGVRFVEDRYIRDRERTLDEVRAAVTALGVHGGGSLEAPGSAVDRARIVSALHLMFEHRRPLAGLAASWLALWEDWSVADEYVRLLLSGEPCLPSTRGPIIGYLQDCPLPSAKAALDQLPGRG